MAISRLSPPSTGSTYTMSARASPVCGRAYTMLSILTASTRCSEGTGSPVNGDRSRAAAEGEGGGAVIGPGPRPVPGPGLAVPQDQRAAGPGAPRQGRAAALLQER